MRTLKSVRVVALLTAALILTVSLSSGPANVVGHLYYGSYQVRPPQVLVHGATHSHALTGIGRNFNLHLNRSVRLEGIDAWIQQHVATH